MEKNRARRAIRIARVTGILAIAAGFMLGIEGLHRPDSVWPAVALGLISAGLCAQVYAVCRIVTGAISSRDNHDP